MINQIIQDIIEELGRADAKYAHDPMSHKKLGLATLKCEVMELEREVERPVEHLEWMRKEAVQSAAMAIKFIRDICDGGGNHA